jgi:hypothetical protein
LAGNSSVAFGSHGSRLLMMRTDITKTAGANGVIEMHGPTACNEKYMAAAPFSQLAKDKIREFHECCIPMRIMKEPEVIWQ